VNIVWHLHREPTSLAEERDKPHHEFIMIWYELQRSIRKDEVRLAFSRNLPPYARAHKAVNIGSKN
jgi:hypothetical protein